MDVQIEVCKDVEKFQESVIAGMDAKHTIFAIAGIVAGAVTGAGCHFLLHTSNVVTMYAVMAAAIPVIFAGFFDRDGMSFTERLKRKKMLKKEHELYSISTESPEYFSSLEHLAVQKETEEMTPEQMKGMLRKAVTAGAAVFVALAAILAVILILK